MEQVVMVETDKRLWPRRKKLLPVFVAHPNEDNEVPQRAWVVDRSPGGIRLLVREAMQEGEFLLVRPASADSEAPWVGVQVKNAQPKDEQQELGCEFVLPSSWDAHLLFS
jgi:PilZ domain-containing protein